MIIDSNKENQHFTINCNCHCGNSFTFYNDFGVIWVDSLENCFYSHQYNFKYYIFDKFKYGCRLLKKQPIFINDICLNKEEVEEFLINLENLCKDLPNEKLEEYENDKNRPTLHLSCLTFDDKTKPIFLLDLKSKLTFKDLIANKEYRQYNTVMTKQDCINFIKKAKRFLEKY